MPPWLNLKLIGTVVIVLAIIVAIGGLYGLWQFERIKVGKLENQIELLNGQVTSLNHQIAVRDSIIEDQKKNIEAIKVSADEMREIIAKSKTIRKKVRELVYVPTGKACKESDELGAEYAKVANDITAFIRTGVRKNITAVRDNSEAAPKVLPGAGSTGIH